MITQMFCVDQVEFPEARIFEETLNVLLYENREKGQGPDQDVMDATKGRHPTNAYHSDDEGDDRVDGNRPRRK